MLQSMGLQSRTHLSNCPELNGNNDTENRFVDTVGEGEVKKLAMTTEPKGTASLLRMTLTYPIST